MRLCKEAMRTQLHPLAKNSEINLHRTSSGPIKMRIMALHGGEEVAPSLLPRESTGGCVGAENGNGVWKVGRLRRQHRCTHCVSVWVLLAGE